MNINIKKILHQHNLKHTKQREAILKVLAKQKAPISVEELYDLLRQQAQTMNLSTLYRSVETFSEHGIIEKIFSSITNTNLIQLQSQHHQHYLVCINCHKMIPIDYCPMDELLGYIESNFHFKVIDHQLEISGYCDTCQP